MADLNTAASTSDDEERVSKRPATETEDEPTSKVPRPAENVDRPDSPSLVLEDLPEEETEDAGDGAEDAGDGAEVYKGPGPEDGPEDNTTKMLRLLCIYHAKLPDTEKTEEIKVGALSDELELLARDLPGALRRFNELAALVGARLHNEYGDVNFPGREKKDQAEETGRCLKLVETVKRLWSELPLHDVVQGKLQVWVDAAQRAAGGGDATAADADADAAAPVADAELFVPHTADGHTTLKVDDHEFQLDHSVAEARVLKVRDDRSGSHTYLAI